MDQEAAKRAAATVAARLVERGMRVGLGTGTTSHWFVVALAERVRAGLDVTCVPTSDAIARLARDQGLVLAELDRDGVDVAVDGADAVDSALRLIKGRGGAMVRERIVAAAARRFVVIADEFKVVPALSGAVPVELLEFGSRRTLAALDGAGAEFVLRRDAAGAPVRSDNGNLVADGVFPAMEAPEAVAAALGAVPGVVGHGLFLGMAEPVIVGAGDASVRELRRP